MAKDHEIKHAGVAPAPSRPGTEWSPASAAGAVASTFVTTSKKGLTAGDGGKQ